MELTEKVSQENIENAIKQITECGCRILDIVPCLNGKFELDIKFLLPSVS